jgi:osmoprotectant transport system substrate-binding protein
MKRLRLLLLLTMVLALVAVACGGDDDDDGAEPTTPSETEAEGEVPDGPDVTIGAQDFGESAILAQVYGQALDAAGYPVKYQSLGGFRDIVYTSFESGDINLTAEYAASALEFLNENAGEATADAQETTGLLRERLAEQGLQALDPSPAVDSNAFVVTPETAEAEGLTTISDLAGKDLTLGGPPDCPTNPFCIPGLQRVYDIDFSETFRSLDAAGPNTVQALENGNVDVAILFSTNGVIADEGWVILEDDKGLINADNVVPVLTDELVETYGDDFTQLLNDVSAALTTEELTELNKRYDIDKEDAETIAEDWLTENELI